MTQYETMASFLFVNAVEKGGNRVLGYLDHRRLSRTSDAPEAAHFHHGPPLLTANPLIEAVLHPRESHLPSPIMKPPRSRAFRGGECDHEAPAGTNGARLDPFNIEIDIENAASPKII
jgi:hypothetical protein